MKAKKIKVEPTMASIILKDVANCLKKKKFNQINLDKKLGVLHVEDYGCCVYVDEKMIGVSFTIGVDGTLAAMLTKDIIDFCTVNYKDYEVEIMEPYIHIYDENEKYVGVLFGDEAFEWYHKNLEPPTTGAKDLEI